MKTALRNIRIETASFEFSHGTTARGFGAWAFQIGTTTTVIAGKFTQACGAARKIAQGLGLTSITLLA